MEIKRLRLKFTLQSDNKVSTDMWHGSQLRGAIKQALVVQNCTNMRVGECDRCKKCSCTSKLLFDTVGAKATKLITNPVTITAEFSDKDIVTDTINFTISLYGDSAIGTKDTLIDAIGKRLYLGRERTKFNVVSISEQLDTFDLSVLDAPGKKLNTINIVFDTPYINKLLQSKGVSKFKSDSLMRAITTRITSMVNTMGLDYTVKFRDLIDNADSFEIKLNLKSAIYKRVSRRTMRNQHIKAYTGNIQLSGDISKIYNYLKLAEFLGIGKECTMGFGRIHIEEG